MSKCEKCGHVVGVNEVEEFYREPDPKPKILVGVCCALCRWFELPGCPVSSASPWSRYGNWCNVYEPNPGMPDAKTIEAAIVGGKI